MRRNSHAIAPNSGQAGFTIIELMIATLVFSMVLLVITVGVLQFSNSYYKGVNSSATQTAAQNAIDTISQAIQFSSAGTAGTGSAPAGVFCAGSKMFMYSKGVQYNGATPSASNWGLYMLPNPHTANCNASDITDFSGGTELLAPKMRLSDISVINTDPVTNLWSVSIWVVYGDSDLLCNAGISGTGKGGCVQGATSYVTTDDVLGQDVHCKAQIGSQFCSAAALSTVAQQRILND